MRALIIFCFLLPVIGIFIAIGSWISGKSNTADKLLFVSFIGILFNILVLLPLGMFVRMLLS